MEGRRFFRSRLSPERCFSDRKVGTELKRWEEGKEIVALAFLDQGIETELKAPNFVEFRIGFFANPDALRGTELKFIAGGVSDGDELRVILTKPLGLN